jgi:transposase
MTFKKGTDRNQLLIDPINFNKFISEENQVRKIDSFVDSIDLQEFGFKVKYKSEIHTAAFHPGDLVKLIIYANLNRIKSANRLAIECTRNIEIMWLIKNLHPCNTTIANFWKNNRGTLRKIYKRFLKETK